jgi:C1A family cysteine protease
MSVARPPSKLLLGLAGLTLLLQDHPALGRALLPQGAQAPPGKEGQLLLNNLWASAHGEAAQRPVVQGEPAAPPAPTLKSMALGARNQFLDQAKQKVERILGETRSGLSSALGASRSGKSGLLGSLETAGNLARKKGETSALLSRAREELTSAQTWNDFAQQFYAQWKQEQLNYLQNVVQYKAGLVGEKVADRFRLKKKMKQSTQAAPGEIRVITGSLDFPVRDQAGRGTCASFTGVRLLEIVLQQNGLPSDLSEQYFYWSSKPKCQTSPCTKSGSWFFEGFEFSKKASGPNIPLEADCPYNPKPDPANDTQIPLGAPCSKGFAKVKRFTILKDTHDEVVAAIRRGQPVAGAFYLSENFFENQGLITLAGARKSQREHSGGHAIVLTGYMALPESLHSSEGKVCFLTTNSWGKGWGMGGHACLTERWMQEHAISHFTVIDEMEVI